MDGTRPHAPRTFLCVGSFTANIVYLVSVLATRKTTDRFGLARLCVRRLSWMGVCVSIAPGCTVPVLTCSK